jgi:hypothetical protein
MGGSARWRVCMRDDLHRVAIYRASCAPLNTICELDTAQTELESSAPIKSGHYKQLHSWNTC